MDTAPRTTVVLGAQEPGVVSLGRGYVTQGTAKTEEEASSHRGQRECLP